MKIKVINNSNHPLPQYTTPGSAGMDLRASLPSPVTIQPMQRVLIPTGLRIAIPQGYEVQIRPRSGMAIKHGITCLNTPGTVDSDYRGDVGIILINLGDEPFTVNDGDRIAQMIVNKYERAEWELTDLLDDTERGEGGFGHSGVR
uniref:dUTP diphosphatase n=1 Tax=virus sp. ctuZj11 TaxID=2825825 RepID=A0A8S5RAP3_9VIRU|nr:MAG TPA: dUTPase [virus sp. ctuZj11]